MPNRRKSMSPVEEQGIFAQTYLLKSIHGREETIRMAKVFRNLIILGILDVFYSPVPVPAQTAPVAILDWQDAGPLKTPHIALSDVPLTKARIAAVAPPKAAGSHRSASVRKACGQCVRAGKPLEFRSDE